MGVLWSHQPRNPLSWAGVCRAPQGAWGKVAVKVTPVSAASEALPTGLIPHAILPPLTRSIYRQYEKCLLPSVRRGMNTPVCHMFC